MNAKPKQIIIDKDAFVGINLDELCNFARNHILILPRVLYDECAKNEVEGDKLLKRFMDIIVAGGYTCPSCMDIAKKEGKILEPYGFLPDLDETRMCQNKFRKGAILYNPDNDDDAREKDIEIANFLLVYNKEIAQEFAPDKLREAEARRSCLEANRLERYRFWIESIDCQDVHELIRKESVKFTNSPDKFCLSSAWVIWHFVRLAYVVYLDYSFLKKGRGAESERRRTLHDLNDIEYVVLLSRADGILTRDEKLVKPLAKAAFPDKDVFSSLDEVPNEYLCHWN